MVEVAKATRVLMNPLRKVTDIAVVRPLIGACCWSIDFSSGNFLDSKVGHFLVRTLLGPFGSFVLSRFYDFRGVSRFVEYVPDSYRIIIAGLASLFNFDLLNVPLKRLIARVGTVYADVLHGKEARSDIFDFFFFCSKESGMFQGRELALGGEHNCKNIFFPVELGEGVKKLHSFLTAEEMNRIRERLQRLEEESRSDIEEQIGTFRLDSRDPVIDVGFYAKLIQEHLDPKTKMPDWGKGQKSDNKSEDSTDTESESDNGSKLEEGGETKTALNPNPTTKSEAKSDQSFRKVLSERCVPFDDEEERKNERHNIRIAMSCLLFSMLTYQTDAQLKEAKRQGMLKGIDIYTVETEDSGTAIIAFVSEKHKFAVFSYRGTQTEVIRQYLTSLDFRTEYFRSLDTEVSDGLGKERAQIRTVYYNEVKKSAEAMHFKQKFCGEKLTPRQLLEHLKLYLGYKIYLTGHSLGGGLATVLAAQLLNQHADVDLVDALITFGATPVGDKNFAKWFNNRIPVSWRFMFGNEFAPMVPPLPYFKPAEETVLVHIGDFFHFDFPTLKAPKNAIDSDKMIRDLAYETGMVDMIMHHNPMTTLRALRYYYTLDSKNPLNRLRLNRKRDPKNKQ